MKSRISLAIFLLLMHLCSWAQIGGDYNPTNPSDPGNPTQEYTLTLKATPTNGGSFNTTSTNIAGGKTYNLRAYPNTDFAFVAWLCNGDTLSKSSSYTYTMPYHDVEIIGVFTYSPSSPSDPNVIAQKYTLTLKATPSDGGSFNTTSAKVSVGERYNLRAYPNTDFAFVAWLCEGDTLSKSASYDYTMPSHNVDITGVFTYRPSSPSDPQEQALKYQLTLTAVPMNSGSFNISNERLTVGSNNSLRTYANTDFVFKRWMIGDSVLSTNPNMDFVMPSHNVQMVGVFEYNPANPANPNRNHWDKQTGEVIVDDFTPDNLSSAISSVISGSSSNDVQMIIVSGRITSNDFGIANNYQNCSLLDLSRVTGVAEVPSYAFDYTNLETVYLPATIEKIGARAFADCSKLSSLTIYAMTPPILESNVFQGVPEGLVVYVPAAAIAQYQDMEAWGKFTLLPIQEDIRSISISLPEGANAADYAQMWLELTNTKSGQRMHYVMTDRREYTFANIIRNTSWNVTLRNERGDVFGQIDNVEVKDEDVAVMFSTLSKPLTVSLTVQTPDGQDVTAQTQVTWTDSQGGYLAQGASLTGLPAGYQTNYRVTLSQELAMLYNTPQSTEYVLTDGDNNIVCLLEAIKQVQLSGKVKDATTGLPLSGATISASQTFGGKYSKTLNAKTDNNGVFALTVANVPTSVAFAATDYVSQTMNFNSNEFDGAGEFSVPDVSLKSITGATISIGFTYTPVEGDAQSWYSDYQNVSYTLYNTTRAKPITQFNVQYPHIVLLEEIEDGDVLRLTAASRTNAFKTVEATATIAEQKAETTFAITELGRIEASFSKTGNATVVGSLYDASGKLVKTYNYSEAKLTINDLADGNYTLVSMGSSRLFNTIYDLAQLPQTGLAEGSDYVLNTVEVKSGQVSAINISEVPTLDESKLYYTGDNTSFTVNKPSIVAGNYLTLTGRIDFKQAYATNVSNVQMIVDLPESCEFVENSVMVGNSTSSYTLNGSRITIPMTRYTDRVRFCIIPTLGGEYAPSAFAQFDIDGETMTQPIGSANYTAKDLSISVPSTVAKTAIPVSGTAIGKSEIEIYDNGVLIGQTTSLANGTWATTCELNEPYNLSRHQIYAKVLTKQRTKLITEVKNCQYDVNAIEVKTVTMSFYNGWLKKNITVLFDFENEIVTPTSYSFYKSTNFNFIIDFSNNDPTCLSNVRLFVITKNGTPIPLQAEYNKKTDKWIANSVFSSDNLPINIDVDFVCNVPVEIDSTKLSEFQEDVNNTMFEAHQEEVQINDAYDQLKDEMSKDYYSVEKVDSLLNIATLYTIRVIRDIEDKLSKGGEQISPYNPDEDTRLKDFGNEKSNEELINNSKTFPPLNVNDKSLDFFKDNASDYTMNIPSVKYEDYYTPEITFSCLSAKDKFLEKGLVLLSDALWMIDEKYSELNPTKVRIINQHEDEIIIDYANQLKKEGFYSIDETDASFWSDLSRSYVDSWNLAKGGSTGLTALSILLDNSEEVYRINKAISSLTTRELRAAHMASYLQQAKELTPVWRNMKAWGRGVSIAGTVVDGGVAVYDLYKANAVYRDWDTLIRQIGEACDTEEATIIIQQAEEYKKWIGRRKIWKGIGDASICVMGVGGLLLAAPTFGTSLALTGIGVGGGIVLSAQNEGYDRQDLMNKADIFNRVYSSAHCRPLPVDFIPYLRFSPVSPVLDPSGYVYEGVASNRIEGVTATAYYKEMVEDMYGDLHENIVKWDASEYAQENPLFTDEYGMYAWDVPQGLWQVKFEKEGYETTYSEWLPVPPPQLDVNIAMKQNRQPEVKAAHAYEDAVEVEFDKYMMPELLTTENISVMQNGTAVEGTVELLNAETAYEGSNESFASKVRFNAAQPFTEQEITLLVNNRVKSYAGIRMQDNYQQTFTIEQEIKQVVSDSVVTVDYGNASTLTVSVLPASASKGKMLTVKTSSPMILGVETEQVTIGNDGKAEITVSGELPGTAALTFTVEGTDKTAMTIANVEQIVIKTVATPKASIASGSTVEKGTAITLTCATEGATIYYTLDGSCPCDNTDARKVYDGTPIIINEAVTIKAMAVAPNMYESEVAEFTYLVEGTGIDNVTVNGQIQIYPLPVHDKVNISAGGKAIKSVTISSMNGVVVASANKPATTVTLDVSGIPTGIYIINVTTVDSTFSRKILKVE